MITPLARLSLRRRIFLFFALLAVGAEASIGLGLYIAYLKFAEATPPSVFIMIAIVAGCAVLGLNTWIWSLFDEHVAKPIESLSADLRARAHTEAAPKGLDSKAKYLGDLAPAIAAISENFGELHDNVALKVQQETAQLSSDKAHLEQLIGSIPNGVILASSTHQVLLYNGHAANIVNSTGKTLALDRSIFDYLDERMISKTYQHLTESGEGDAELELSPQSTNRLRAQMRLLENVDAGPEAPAYVLTFRRVEGTLDDGTKPRRSITYDFDLLSKPRNHAIAGRKLRDLVFVVFDTETTGLLPSQGDEIVQIAAIRCVNGRMVDGETFESLVNPGRAIPPAATEIHHITNEMVQDAPHIETVGKQFHRFAEGAVLVAHNAPFDMEFLRRHEAGIGARFDHPILDTVLLSSVIYGRYEDHTLDTMTKRLDISIPDADRHSAMGDTLGTAKALLKLIPLLEAKGLDTFGAVVTEVKKHKRLLKDLN